MIALAHYRIDALMWESSKSLIYHGYRKADQRPVVLKMLKEVYPSPEQIARFKREYEVMHHLNPSASAAEPALAGVVAAYDLEFDQQRWLIALEDFGGKSLPLLGLAGRIDLVGFLTLAIAIVEIVGHIHERHIIHKDINPSNIVFNSSTGQVKLIDFGLSTMVSRETPTLRNPNVLEGTLAYISPEQTGRMNRAIDYRTDFYSLGVTLYELLTGHPPFSSSDAMELVHAHIAQQPIPPHRRRPAIPELVSDIVMKLMAKNAEDRYQSVQGLKHDLEMCLRHWQAEGRIEPFPLGQHDVSDWFQISQKLYGREREIELLLAAFERISAAERAIEEQREEVSSDRQDRGGAEMMLVSGYAGIGKSALVHEIYKPIVRRHGYFIAGKFDQLQRNIPYSGFIQAFRSLIRYLLTGSEADVAAWRERLLAALGPNGQVLIEVIPEVELIAGPQPGVPELAPLEAQNRFNLVLQRFIGVFTRPEHPLVLFLDDLQWADGASLKLLELLMTAADAHALFVIGAYRANEVNEAHPLMLPLSAIQKAGRAIDHISVSPLELPHVIRLLADTLHSPPAQVEPLAELVLSKTGGNPFFLTEFVKSLYAESLITFDYRGGGWHWRLEDIQGRAITDNVVELLASKIHQLPLETQTVLKLAACIGNQFDLKTLAVVSAAASGSQKSPRDAALALSAAIAEGLVLPLSDTYKLMEIEVQNLAESLSADYKFAHDRVQQAVYSLIPEQDKQVIHGQVGRLLLENIPPDEREQNIFTIVNQLNLSTAIIEHTSERDELAALNLVAGRKAKASAAYDPALNHFQVGIALLGNAGWQRVYDLTLALHIEAAEAAYLSGAFEQMDGYVAAVLERARTPLDQAKVHEVRVRAYVAQNNPPAAIKTALQALARLGVDLPEHPSEADIGAGLVATQATWADRRIADLIDLPRMVAPDRLAALQIISTVMPVTYVAAPTLVPVLAFAMVSLSLEYGNAPASTFGYATYGLVLCGVVQDVASGYQFGQLALNLLERLDAREFKARTYFYVHLFITHWKRHLRESLAPALEAYQSGLETGDISNGALSAMLYCYHAYVAGQELTRLTQEMAAYSQAMRQLKQDFALLYNELYRHAALSWVQEGSDSGRFLFEEYYEQTLPLLQETRNDSAIWIVYLNRLIFYYTFERYAEALAQAVRAEPYMASGSGAITPPLFLFYDSLTRLALYPETAEAEQAGLLQRVAANQATMERWAQHAPMNFLHKWYLVEAERARVLGAHSQARELYDTAIDLAQEHEYINEVALAYELAGRFYLAQEHSRLARYYLHDAHYAYRQWGAAVKAKDLAERYPQLVAQARSDSARVSTTTSTSSTTVSGALDLASVLKASQAISGEIALDALLTKLMKVVIENAGAQKGYLLLPANGSLSIEAAATVDQDRVAVLQAIPLAAAAYGQMPLVSAAIINYVAHTRESLVLNDAVHEGPFTQDSYIIARRPLSVLCTPLLNHGTLSGILYLENSLTTDAFTTDRIEVLKLLSAQIAISIENARLYTNLERSEKKYRTLFEDSKDTIFITSPAGLVLDVNPAGSLLLGYSREELMRMRAQDFYVHPADQLRFRHDMEQHGQLRDFEVKLRKRDRTEMDCLITATARLDEHGTVVAYEGIIRDVSAQKQAERERLQLSAIQRELTIAQEIQVSLLPPVRPAWQELDVVCHSTPAREVGGDLYSYHAIDLPGNGSPPDATSARRYALTIGDVAGKGLPAALLMAVSLASLQSMIGQGLAPAELIAYLDKAIRAYTRTTRQNCALVYVELTPARPPSSAEGTAAVLQVVNAGCVTPLIRRRDGAVEWVDVGGMPLGTGLGARLGYQVATRTMSRGDMLILSSDGVVEANNTANEMFGFERFERSVASGPITSAEAMLAHLRAEVAAFVEGAEPHDDVTLVVARV